MKLCEKLKNERLSRKVTQTALASKLGISRSTLSAWESGKRTPSVEFLRKYAEIFSLDSNFFSEEKQNSYPLIKTTLDLTILNYKGIKKMQEFYETLINNEEYLKKS